jgi:hypothetical protein
MPGFFHKLLRRNDAKIRIGKPRRMSKDGIVIAITLLGLNMFIAHQL